MKLLITQNIYRGSNNELQVSGDLKRVSAYSYDWWKYITTDSVGNVIFNDTSYSVSTSKHQRDAFYKLLELGIKPALVLRNTIKSVKDYESAIMDEINSLEAKCNKMLRAITSKGTHTSKNLERINDIDSRVSRILELKRFLDEFLDKKPYEARKFKPTSKNHSIERDLWCRLTNWRINQALERYDKLPEAFKRWGIKCCKLDAAIYPFTKDVAGMLESLDPRDKKLRGKVQKLMAAQNTLALDKLHTYLVNKANRKVYTPVNRNEEVYNINPRLKGREDLRPIVNRYQLRAEGRRQSHCIGSHGAYHDRIVSNQNQAFNFKGYTFYTTYDLKVIAAHGAHNRPVPGSVYKELEKILNQ